MEIVLRPPRAAAATFHSLIAYDAALVSTTRTERTLRPERGVHVYVCDDAHDGYDDASNRP